MRTFVVRMIGIVVFIISLSVQSPGEAKTVQPASPLGEVYEVTFIKKGDFWISPVIKSHQPFNAVIVELTEKAPEFEMKTSGEWRRSEVHEDGFGPNNLFFTEPAKTVRFRNTYPVFAKVTLLPYQKEVLSTENQLAGPLLARGYQIIKREEWGADENLRLWNPEWKSTREGGEEGDKTATDPCGDVLQKYQHEVGVTKKITQNAAGDFFTWPMAYSREIRKIIIHHTDSEVRDLTGDHRMDSLDMKAIIRAIYQFHTVSRGWGDIGYNYIIDPFGNIYEGRAGGERVIGAHALCHNNGTIGIAIIGNYEDNQVPEPALNAAIQLVAQKAKLNGLNPEAESTFRGKLLPNVIGHKDVRATSCPGMQLYASLPIIRKKAEWMMRGAEFSADALAAATEDYSARLISEVNVINMHPTNRHQLTLRFQNIGKKTWDQNTWLHVALNNQKQMQVVPLIEDKRFVAADLREKSVATGQVGTFDIELEAGYEPGFYTFELAPVVNGRFKISHASVVVPILMDQPQFGYEVISIKLPKGKLFQGQKLEGYVELKNTGNVIWRNFGDHKIALGADHPRDRKSLLIKENPSRLAVLKQSEIPPGKVGRFIFTLDIPTNKEGAVREYFTPVIEGVRWLEDKGLNFEGSIKKPVHKARITKKTTISRMQPGEMRQFEIEIENQGDLRWTEEVMKITLASTGLKIFKKEIVPLEPVEPEKKATYTFWVQAPYEEGVHSVSLRSRFNRIAIRGGWTRFSIRVPRVSLRARLVEQENRNFQIDPGTEKTLRVRFKNVGNAIWRNKGSSAIYLAPSHPRDRKSRLLLEEEWQNAFRAATLKETQVSPGETGTFEFKIRPPRRGVYKEYFQLVVENVSWLDGSNIRWDIRAFKERRTDGREEVKKTPEKKPEAKEPPAVPSVAKPEKVPDTTQEDGGEDGGTKEIKESSPPIRIRLSFEEAEARIKALDDYRVEDGEGNRLFDIKKDGIVKINVSPRHINIVQGALSKNKTVFRLVPKDPENGRFEIQTWERRPAWDPTLNDNQFRGALELRLVKNRPVYINELPLEQYMRGLGEVSNSHPKEKLKTIAVLARTYARFYIQKENRKFPGFPFDGSDSPDIFQKYLGYGYEVRSPNFSRAVKETEGQVVTYQGTLVKTPYFNQSDGRTRSAEEVWGWKNTPYLQSVDDPWCDEKVLKGHGVGLSGCGATRLAEQGKNYEAIIKYYYQGVEIEKKTD